MWHPRISEHPLGQAVWQPEGPYSHPSPLPAPTSFRLSWSLWPGDPFGERNIFVPIINWTKREKIFDSSIKYLWLKSSFVMVMRHKFRKVGSFFAFFFQDLTQNYSKVGTAWEIYSSSRKSKSSTLSWWWLRLRCWWRSNNRVQWRSVPWWPGRASLTEIDGEHTQPRWKWKTSSFCMHWDMLEKMWLEHQHNPENLTTSINQ